MKPPFVILVSGILVVLTILMIIAYMTPDPNVQTVECTPDNSKAIDEKDGRDCCSMNGVASGMCRPGIYLKK
jgi:hypothetical protein